MFHLFMRVKPLNKKTFVLTFPPLLGVAADYWNQHLIQMALNQHSPSCLSGHGTGAIVYKS